MTRYAAIGAMTLMLGCSGLPKSNRILVERDHQSIDMVACDPRSKINMHSA
jgi:hypothetical protein